ncbi:molybdopterin binding oxidoreductase [Clavulina sp. PMI_390]|nr:molybdopterin binding oxidoreductase [Clavulina sp. PMI_390]
MEVLQQHPFNAQPNPRELTESFVTPIEKAFARNHGSIPEIAEDSYSLQLTLSPAVCRELVAAGLKCEPINAQLSLADIKTIVKQSDLVAALECAGNRRSEMNIEKKTEGIEWGSSVISNIEWQGPLLHELLALKGIDLMNSSTNLDNFHIHFKSSQKVQDDSYYASSIPLSKLKEVPVILAHTHNGMPLTKEHGFPLRAVLPGYIGARSVKWITEISIEDHESTNFYQALDYKRIEPKDNLELNKLSGDSQKSGYRAERLRSTQALAEEGPSCAITKPMSGDRVRLLSPDTLRGEAMHDSISQLVLQENANPQRLIAVKGYAMGAHGSPISRVQIAPVSFIRSPHTLLLEEINTIKSAARDFGVWTEAQRLDKEDGTFINGVKVDSNERKQTDSKFGVKSWAWCLWEGFIELPAGVEEFSLVARVETEDGTKQEYASSWNLRGVDNRAWFVARDLHIEAEVEAASTPRQFHA